MDTEEQKDQEARKYETELIDIYNNAVEGIASLERILIALAERKQLEERERKQKEEQNKQNELAKTKAELKQKKELNRKGSESKEKAKHTKKESDRKLCNGSITTKKSPNTNDYFSIIFDCVLLILIPATTYWINTIAIPYINKFQEYSAYAIRIDYGIKGIIESLRTVSPTEWFHTKLYSVELPNYKWYIALLIASMVQILIEDLEFYLDLSWIKKKGEIARFFVNAISSYLLTEFMLSLTLLSLLTICPQNIKLLFMILELVIICLPAFVHALVLRRGFFSFLDTIAFFIRAFLTFLTFDKTVFCGIVLYVVNVIFERIREAQPDISRRNVIKVCALFISMLCVVSSGLFILSKVEVHKPVVKKETREILVSSIAVRGDDALFIRKDNTAIDMKDNAYLENVVQTAPCISNNYFLLDSGELMVCSKPSNKPIQFMRECKWIAYYSDVLIIIDAKGDLWGVGDLTWYLPEGEYTPEPVKLIENQHLVKADVGKGHILMIDDRGDLYSMGQNEAGELGRGYISLSPEGPKKILSDIKDAKAGNGYSYALSNDGIVYVWGRNEVGQLGKNVTIKPFKAGNGYATNVGDVCITEPTELDVMQVPIRQIAIGAECGFALDEIGRLWVWGNNIARDSIASPTIRRESISWVADNKINGGNRAQRCYFIADSGKAYSMLPFEQTEYNAKSIELIFDDSNWFPKPIEDANSLLEEILDNLPLFRDMGNSGADGQEELTVFRNPINDNSVHSLHTFNGHTYQVINENMLMNNAESYCDCMGGHLLTVTSAEEHEFINQLVNSASKDGMHFGTALKYNGYFYWSTKESIEYINSLNIKPGLDDELAEGYVDIFGRLNVGMMVKHPFICEWDYIVNEQELSNNDQVTDDEKVSVEDTEKDLNRSIEPGVSGNISSYKSFLEKYEGNGERAYNRVAGEYGSRTEMHYFYITDLNQDGIDDLVTYEIVNFRYHIIRFYTLDNNNVIPFIFENGEDALLNNNHEAVGNCFFYICPEGHIHNDCWRGEFFGGEYTTYVTEGNTIVSYLQCVDHTIINKGVTYTLKGSEISREEYESLTSDCKNVDIPWILNNAKERETLGITDDMNKSLALY